MKDVKELSYYIAEKLHEKFDMIGNWEGHCSSCSEYVNSNEISLAKIIEDIILKSADEDILEERNNVENNNVDDENFVDMQWKLDQE